MDSVARDEIGYEEQVNYTRRSSWLEQVSRELGVSIGTGIGRVLGGRFQIN